MRKSLPFLLMLAWLLAGCSARTSEQIYTDLWKTWEAMDELLQEDYPGEPPIILVHGWNGGEFTWPSPGQLQALEDRLHRDIYLFTYRTGIVANRYPPLELLEEKLDRFLSAYPTVDIVAHSMGGLLLRQYLSHHPENPVRRVVFLSTPHFGTNAAQILSGLASISAEGNIQASEIRPGSDFLWQLNNLEGAELEGIEVLNVYVGEESLFDSDFVVGASSAWIPWGHNVRVTGDHHTGKRLPEFDFVLSFLQDGTLPKDSPAPKRRDLWLHFIPKAGDLPESFSASALKRIGPKGVPVKAGLSFCCEERSGLYPMGGRVAVVEDLQAGERIIYYSRATGVRIELKAEDYLQSPYPVQLKEIILQPEESAVEPEEGLPAIAP